MRSLWFGLACALFSVLLVTRCVGPAREGLVQRRPVEELGFKNPRRAHDRIASERPEVVIVGNSVMDAAVDVAALQELTGRTTMELMPHGSSSALWYLLLKNVIATAPQRPRFVVIGFRSVFLTEPDYRTQGRYRRRIDYFATPDEPLLDELAYFRDTGPLELFAMRHWSVWQRREELRASTETWFKTLAARVLGLEPDALRGAVERAFSDENKVDAAVNEAQERAELVVDRRHFDFPAQLERSFLPEMLRIAREAGIELVFVRLPTRRTAENDDPAHAPAWHRDWMPAYEADLFAYMKEQGVPLLDFEGDPRIPAAWFASGDHLGEDPGQVEFTKFLAAALQPILDGSL